MTILLFANIVFSQTGQMTDNRDGRTYKTIFFDKFEIMAENLKFGKAGICYSKENIFCSQFGRLYDYKDVVNNICPDGWHIPTEGEWRYILLKIKGEIYSRNNLYAVSNNENLLKLSKGGIGSAKYNDATKVQFSNVNLNGFYASSSTVFEEVGGIESEKWIILTFEDNGLANNPSTTKYKYTFQIGSTSINDNVSCRCMKDY